MFKTTAYLFVFAALLLATTAARAQVVQRPVILVVFDDLFDLVDQKNNHGVTIHAPNFDRLASKGVRFSNAFVSATACNPSRSSFMTGLSPFRTTIHVPEPVQWNEVLPGNASFVDTMRGVGYEALSCGKIFHNQARIEEQTFYDSVFDVNFQSFDRLELPSGRLAIASEETQADDIHVGWAVDQLNNYETPQAGEMPMFLSVGIIRPHAPFIAPQRFFDLYPAESLNAGGSFAANEADLDDVSEFYKQFRLLDNYHNNLVANGLAVEFAHGYLASISYADELLGDLLDAIESNKDLANATIIVTSDNGYQLGEKLTWNKFTLWEESAKVPLYVVDPSLEGGSTCDIPVSLLDLAPTITKLGNAKPSDLHDGEDLLEIATHPKNYVERAVVTTMIGSLSIRNQQHRLILYNDGSMELYDVVADPSELTNLVSEKSQQPVIDSLLTQLNSVTTQQGATSSLTSLSVSGGPGNDALFVIGEQLASGGPGDDNYFVAAGGQIVENDGEGYDTAIYAATDIEIPLGVEFVRSSLYSNNLTYNIEGNSEDNRVSVLAARGWINGYGGDDLLTTGNARDRLDGGDGNDFLWTTGGRINLLVGGQGADVIIGGEREDIIHCGLTPKQLTKSASQSTHGDFVLSGDVYVLTNADRFLDNGDVELARGQVIDFHRIPFVRKDGSFFVFGSELLFHGDTDSPLSEFDIDLVNSTINRLIPGDFFMASDGLGDEVFGSNGDDLLVTTPGNDRIDSGPGNDFIFANEGDDFVTTSSGNDLVMGGGGDNTISCGPGDDKVSTLDGADSIDGGIGIDTISSGSGEDEVYGRAGDDIIRLQGGDDFCSSGSGDDNVECGIGNDTAHGNGGNDQLFGQGGNDNLFGGPGNDWIEGGGEDDEVSGQAGNDDLKGGPGNDMLTGGTGSDRFWFSRFQGNKTVTDFNRALDFVVIPIDSQLYTLTVEEIVDDQTIQVGNDTVIVNGARSMTIKNLTADELLGRIVKESY